MTALISIERYWSPLLWFRSEMMLVAWLREVGMEKERRLFTGCLRGNIFRSWWWIGYWGWGKEKPRDSYICTNGDAIPYRCVGGGAICTGGRTHPHNCMVVTFHATVCMWYFSWRVEFWKRNDLGGMGEGNYQCGDGNIKFELSLVCSKEDVK